MHVHTPRKAHTRAAQARRGARAHTSHMGARLGYGLDGSRAGPVDATGPTCDIPPRVGVTPTARHRTASARRSRHGTHGGAPRPRRSDRSRIARARARVHARVCRLGACGVAPWVWSQADSRIAYESRDNDQRCIAGILSSMAPLYSSYAIYNVLTASIYEQFNVLCAHVRQSKVRNSGASQGLLLKIPRMQASP